MNRLALTLLAFAPLVTGAQAKTEVLDRKKVPALGKTPVLKLPTVERDALTNGVSIQLVGQHEVPLVQITLVIAGGWRLDANSPGLATFTSRVLTEGAGTRDANALQSEIAFLGAQLGAGAGSDEFTVSLNVPTRTLPAALDLMADIVLRPAFPGAAIKRQRDLALANILQRKDNPTQIAPMAFDQIVFPAGHPYHNPSGGDSATIAGLDSAKVRTFYRRAFVPYRAKFIVVGDISQAELKPLLQARFGSWKSQITAAPIPAVTVQPVTNSSIKLYLVDKPGAAQSVIVFGNPGTDRMNPDYAAIQVMNTILGGSFSSRLMSNLRETKGYTYGVNSGFAWSPVPGSFQISTSVRTDVTDSSMIEIFKEVKAIREKPVDAAELDRAKNYIALALPGRFETGGSIAGQLVTLNRFSLPLSSITEYGAAINRVTAADIQRVANKYIAADKVTIVIVGDLAKIRSGIESLKLGATSVLEVSSIVR